MVDEFEKKIRETEERFEKILDSKDPSEDFIAQTAQKKRSNLLREDSLCDFDKSIDEFVASAESFIEKITSEEEPQNPDSQLTSLFLVADCKNDTHNCCNNHSGYRS